MSGNTSKVLMFFILLFTISAAGYVDAGNRESNHNRVVSINVTHSITGLLPIGSTVVATKSVVLTAQLPGRVKTISGKEGDHFKAGEVLLRLDDKELQIQRRMAVTKWASARTALVNSTVQHHKTIASKGSSRQIPGGMGIPAMFDEMFVNPMSNMMGTRDTGAERRAALYASSTNINQANHALHQALASIEQIDSKLRDSLSVAPFDGVIVDKYVEIGDTLQPGQRVLKFEDTDNRQIVADVPVKLAAIIKEGDVLSAILDTHNIRIPVQVENVFPSVDPSQHTVTVKFNLPDTISAPTGTYAVIFVPHPSEKKDNPWITVPTTAVAQRGGLPVIFIFDDNTQIVSMRLVRPGQKLANGMTVIEYGLKEGDLIVDNPSSYLISGNRLSRTH